ncbi:MAG TPA: pyridoxamine 5'-phosphate oxidase family protein [Candidatus Peribacteraceae bacterium]|nr:pyridoxamine 5'-phosphate oxidase family protein [Candidatus Peribacteraceae bacterium]
MRIDLTFEQCEDILKQQHYGHLGCCMDGEPYVVPATYVYKYGYLYSFTHDGQKIAMMRKHPSVCLQVECVRSGYDWESVICWGKFEEITDEQERHEIELLLADQYAKVTTESDELPVSPLIQELNEQKKDDVKKSVVYRINIQKTTGKAERPKKS